MKPSTPATPPSVNTRRTIPPPVDPATGELAPAPAQGAAARLRAWAAGLPLVGRFVRTGDALDTPVVPFVRGEIDVPLLTIALLLVAFGVVMVYSASAIFAARSHGSAQYYLMRQASYAVVGLCAMAAFARLDYRVLRKLTYPMLIGTVGLLVMVIAGFGRSGGGAARWLRFGPVSLQPAELAKVTIVLWLAHSLSKKREKIKTFTIGFLPHLMMAGILMVLCLKQPDFGSSVVLLLLTFTLMFVAGAKTGYILGAIVAALPVAWQLIMGSAYRRRRWEAFVDPWAHRHDISYQLVESLMSFGAGGPTGLGLGDSRQKLFFLPEAHTDFIGAIIGEELGFVGVCCLLVMYGYLVYRGVTIALRAADDYGTYVAMGISTLFSLQVLINLGVAMGILPTKGLTLPLVSYGGTSLCINLVAIGILLSISRGGSQAAAREAAMRGANRARLTQPPLPGGVGEGSVVATSVGAT